MSLKVGQKAPDFKVNDQDGNPISLSQFKGKKVVLYFYPKDQTPGCTVEACNLRDNYKVLQKKGYEILGVSTDNEKSHQKFIAKQQLPFSLLADTEKKLHEKYGTWVEKSMYGRKYMGTARVTFVIDEKGVIEEIIEKVDTKNHTNQILGDAKPAKNTAPKKAAKAKKTPAKKAKKPASKSSRKK
ncbi:MAG: thioredoxin-dependent thiol peroxidase [Cyclobacteriaceae bacterium]|nr:thioredoxin-dependent thiol peroxidase [Cyclobacteriaceae bacterium]